MMKAALFSRLFLSAGRKGFGETDEMHKLKKDPARFLRGRIFFYCGDRGNKTATR